MNRRNALARIAAALAALVAAPKLLWARKAEAGTWGTSGVIGPADPIADIESRLEDFAAPHISDNMFRRHFATKRNAWYHGPPLGERYDEVLQRRHRELSRELTRISLSFWVPPWER